jgi:pyrroline-5-carboxylate reductase
MEIIGFLGSGNMAEALIKAILSANTYKPENIFISDIRQKRLDFLAKQFGVQKAKSNADLAEKVDILVLSVKPQNITEALHSIKSTVKQGSLIISIAAGIKISNITQVLGDRPIVRVMPNTPALVGQAATALFANQEARPMLQKAKKIFSAVGIAVTVDQESLMDAVTAVSGSGPAYFFLLIEEMIKSATELGLPAETAKLLVLQTAKGAALLAGQADEKGETVAELRQKVTSPGGTTEAALEVFKEGKFAPLIAAAIKAAHHRSHQLSTDSKH